MRESLRISFSGTLPGGAGTMDRQSGTFHQWLQGLGATSAAAADEFVSEFGRLAAATLLLAVPAPVQGQAKVLSRPHIQQAQSETFSRAKFIGLADLLYVNAHKDTFPLANSTKAAFKALEPYAKLKNVFVSLNPNGSHFVYNLALSSVPVAKVVSPATTLVAYDEKPWPDLSRVAVFADGHAEIVNPKDWAVDCKSLKLKFQAGKG